MNEGREVFVPAIWREQKPFGPFVFTVLNYLCILLPCHIKIQILQKRHIMGAGNRVDI